MLGQNVAGVAQLVEQLICNQQVGGSTPLASSININGLKDHKQTKNNSCQHYVSEIKEIVMPTYTDETLHDRKLEELPGATICHLKLANGQFAN